MVGSARPKGIRVRTSHVLEEELIAEFKHLCDEQSLFLPTTRELPKDAACAFSLELVDGTPMLRGLGVIVEVFPSADNRFGKVGVLVAFDQLTTTSEPILDRLLAAREATPRRRTRGAPLTHQQWGAVVEPATMEMNVAEPALDEEPTAADTPRTITRERHSVAPPIASRRAASESDGEPTTSGVPVVELDAKTTETTRYEGPLRAPAIPAPRRALSPATPGGAAASTSPSTSSRPPTLPRVSAPRPAASASPAATSARAVTPPKGATPSKGSESAPPAVTSARAVTPPKGATPSKGSESAPLAAAASTRAPTPPPVPASSPGRSNPSARSPVASPRVASTAADVAASAAMFAAAHPAPASVPLSPAPLAIGSAPAISTDALVIAPHAEGHVEGHGEGDADRSAEARPAADAGAASEVVQPPRPWWRNARVGGVFAAGILVGILSSLPFGGSAPPPSASAALAPERPAEVAAVCPPAHEVAAAVPRADEPDDARSDDTRPAATRATKKAKGTPATSKRVATATAKRPAATQVAKQPPNRTGHVAATPAKSAATKRVTATGRSTATKPPARTTPRASGKHAVAATKPTARPAAKRHTASARPAKAKASKQKNAVAAKTKRRTRGKCASLDCI